MSYHSKVTQDDLFKNPYGQLQHETNKMLRSDNLN